MMVQPDLNICDNKGLLLTSLHSSHNFQNTIYKKILFENKSYSFLIKYSYNSHYYNSALQYLM